MDKKEFDKAVGKIFGVKTGVKWVGMAKNITTGEVIVRLEILANESQAKKLLCLAMNGIPKAKDKS